MDATTVNAIITGSAGLIGALIGAGSASLVSWIQHKRETATKATEERRKDEQDAVKKCEEICVRIADNMEKSQHPSVRPDRHDIQREKLARTAYTGLNATSLYLPAELRERVETLGSVAYHADEISFGGSMHIPTHYDSPYTICWNVKREVRALVAAYLRGEKLPTPGQKVAEYKVALTELDEQQQEYYGMIEQDDPQIKNRKERKEDFYKNHPDLRTEEIG